MFGIDSTTIKIELYLISKYHSELFLSISSARPLLLGCHDVHRHDWDHGPVHGHGHRHLVQRNVIEQYLHVLHGVNGDLCLISEILVKQSPQPFHLLNEYIRDVKCHFLWFVILLLDGIRNDVVYCNK